MPCDNTQGFFIAMKKDLSRKTILFLVGILIGMVLGKFIYIFIMGG